MLTGEVFQKISENNDDESDDNDLISNDIENVEFDELHLDALEYLAGYILKKLQRVVGLGQLVEKNQKTWTWVNEISEGGLIKPSTEFLDLVNSLEKQFVSSKTNIINKKNVLKNFLNITKNIPLDEKIKKLFFKCRIYFFIREKNKNIKNDYLNKKKKIRKIKKIINYIAFYSHYSTILTISSLYLRIYTYVYFQK